MSITINPPCREQQISVPGTDWISIGFTAPFSPNEFKASFFFVALDFFDNVNRIFCFFFVFVEAVGGFFGPGLYR